MEAQQENSIIQLLLSKTIHSHKDFCEAVDALKQVGTDNAANGVYRLFIKGDDSSLDSPLLDGEKVKYALSALKEMNGAFPQIAALIIEEAKKHDQLKSYVALKSAQHSVSSDTHEDDAIQIILDEDSENTPAALFLMLGHYPEKVSKALATLDRPYIPKTLSTINKVDFDKGISSQNISGLHDLVDMHEQIESGTFTNISSQDVKGALKDNCETILNADKLLHYLSSSQPDEADKTDDVPSDYNLATDEIISGLQEAFRRVDNVSSIGMNKLEALFNQIVDEHNRRVQIDNTLESLQSGTFKQESTPEVRIFSVS